MVVILIYHIIKYIEDVSILVHILNLFDCQKYNRYINIRK